MSTATTVQEAKKTRQIPFNAWDASGKQYRDFKSPTEGSSLSSAASVTFASNNEADSKSSVSNDPYLIGDWTVVTASAEPDPEEARKKNSKWPKSGAVSDAPFNTRVDANGRVGAFLPGGAEEAAHVDAYQLKAHRPRRRQAASYELLRFR